MEQSVQDFLATVWETSQERRKTLKAGSTVWRAQIGNEWELIEDDEPFEVPAPFSPDRMKPLPHQASEGRANPKGLPYLYVANNRETAVSEVRAWVGSLVSVGQFRITHDLSVIDCTFGEKPVRIYWDGVEPDPEERVACVWDDIDEAFARPVTGNEFTADYAPTQILAEFFREKGIDGIVYKSSLGPGHNLVCFDIDSAQLVSCSVIKVERIILEFSEESNLYVVTGKVDRSESG